MKRKERPTVAKMKDRPSFVKIEGTTHYGKYQMKKQDRPSVAGAILYGKNKKSALIREN